eukprot:GHVS01015590.1.p1 GENE.GHVS01015590.1~~GHVS01015590.1.p1  ORF type:complete len:539 (-),score=79.71 GHVS01015590.1:178-1611(-)
MVDMVGCILSYSSGSAMGRVCVSYSIPALVFSFLYLLLTCLSHSLANIDFHPLSHSLVAQVLLLTIHHNSDDRLPRTRYLRCFALPLLYVDGRYSVFVLHVVIVAHSLCPSYVEEGAFELLKRAIPIAILWFCKTKTNLPILSHTTPRVVFLSMVYLLPLLFLSASELSYNISLAFTSVPTSNILASTSTLFTFVFSLWSRQIAFSFLTVINLLVLFIGLSVVLLSKPTSYVSIRSAHTGLSLSQITSSSLSHLSSPTLYSSSPTLYSSSPTPHISPSSLTVVGSAVPTDTSYGAWTAVLSALLCSLLSLVASSNLPQQERRVQDEGEVRGSVRELLMETTSGGSQTTGRTRKVDSTKVFGLVGLLIILFSPVVILLTPVLSSEVPSLPSSTALLFLLANGLLGTSLPDLLWLRSVSLLSPLTSTAALTLSVPTSQFADIFLLHNHSFSASYLLGSALALAAVICLIFRHNRGTNRS